MTFRSKLSTLTMCLAASTLMAQDTTGTIAGRITGMSGAPIGGARVQISSPSLLGVRTVRTDASGHYRIALLPNGEYTISSDAPEFVGARGSFRVLAGQTSHFDLALKRIKDVETVQSAVVEVTGNSSQVDKTETVTQTNFAMETLNLLGNNDTGSMYLMLGSMTPGLSSSDLGKQDGLKIRGGTGHGTKTLINGSVLSEEGGGYVLDSGTIADMVDSVAVIQSPLNARYGNTDGGIVSVVTTKGSNTFQGSVRLNFSRPYWGADNVPYANRTGTSPAFNPTTDEVTRQYEYTIKGPIWKDHITFAYGGIITPTQYFSYPMPILQNNPATPNDPNGIYYRDQATGNVIRKTNLWAQGQYTTDTQKRTYNQFIIFGQITPDHSLEWNYTQDDQDYISNYGVMTNDMFGNDAYKMRNWNLGYKGIIGNHGILEARYSRYTRAFPHPYSPSNPPIFLNTYSTNAPNPDGSYVANSLLEGIDSGNTVSNNLNGFVTDKGDILKGESTTLNYQHLLDLAGTHMIDVGMEREGFQWNTQASGNKYQYSGPGQIADDLSAGDITGGGPANPALYAGKYIVFNYNALQSNLDPNYGGDPVLGNYNSLIPQVRVLSGSEDGSYRMVTNSYYVNDLWTLNQNHSVMGGLRYDQLKVTDSVKTIASYGIPTVRFEYKWDLFGDQSRIVNASFGQFHSRQPGSLFYPMIQGRLANSTTYYWNQGSGTPYLVDKAQFLNLANYGYVANQTFAGQSFVVDPGWKAPVSNELTVGFRRSYQSGGYWRATAIYRKWTNLFDFFPGQVYTTAAGTQGFHTVLKNDPGAERTYKSAELEWSIPLTKKLTFGGNYTWSRLMSNVRNMLDNPSRSGSQTNNSTNFRDWYLTQLPRSEFNPVTLRDPEHTVKWYATYNLSAGKVKSNLALRGSYTSGVPMTRSFTYNTPYPVIPGYYDGPAGTNRNTGGLINTLSEVRPGYTNQDLWNVHLQYNVEFPIVRSIAWFTNVQVNNLFNNRTSAAYALPGQAGRDNLSGPATRNPYGYQLGTNLTNIYAKDGSGNYIYRQGLRSISVQTGIRF
jgi:Carboxypeptidase regulatory-like domain